MIDIEKVWNAEGIEKARGELRSQERVIDEAIATANRLAAEARKESENLQGNILPGLLVERVFDEKVPRVEITKAKKRRSELKEVIDDLPLLLKGFEDERKKLHSDYRKIEKRERLIGSYERAKNSLKERYSPYLERDFLNKAELLGCCTDAKKFLKDLKENEVKN